MEIDIWKIIKKSSRYTEQVYEKLELYEVSDQLKVDFSTQSHGKRYDEIKVHHLSLNNNSETKFNISSLSRTRYYIETSINKVYNDIYHYTETIGTMRTGNDDWENTYEWVVTYNSDKNKLEHYKIFDTSEIKNLINSNLICLIAGMKFSSELGGKNKKINYSNIQNIVSNGYKCMLKNYQKKEVESIVYYCISQAIAELIVRIILQDIKHIMQTDNYYILKETNLPVGDLEKIEQKLYTSIRKSLRKTIFDKSNYFEIKCNPIKIILLVNSEQATIICPINSFYDDPFVLKLPTSTIMDIEKALKEGLTVDARTYSISLDIK